MKKLITQDGCMTRAPVCVMTHVIVVRGYCVNRLLRLRGWISCKYKTCMSTSKTTDTSRYAFSNL